MVGEGSLHAVTLRVNGVDRTATVPARRLLSDLLRHDLGLTGTHVGCEHGVCGACTILLDGAPVRSCLLLAVTVDGHEVTTVEGLAAADGTLHPVQRAFRECHGLQCGFCTPGFLTTIAAFVAENNDPTRDGGRGGDLRKPVSLHRISEHRQGHPARRGTRPRGGDEPGPAVAS